MMESQGAKAVGRTYCIYKNCASKDRNVRSGTKLKYFRIPKNETRCPRWLQSCGRQDILEKPDFTAAKAYRNYRVCSIHFENSMFNDPIGKSRLLSTAEPIPFQATESAPIVGEFNQSNALDQQEIKALSTSAIPTEEINVPILKNEELIIKEDKDPIPMNVEPIIGENDIKCPIKEEWLIEERDVTIDQKNASTSSPDRGELNQSNALVLSISAIPTEKINVPIFKNEELIIKEDNDPIPMNVEPIVGENDIKCSIKEEWIMEDNDATIPIKQEYTMEVEAVTIDQKNVSTSSAVISIAHRQTQTSAVLWRNSCRVGEFSRGIRNLKNENRRLQRRIEKLEEAILRVKKNKNDNI